MWTSSTKTIWSFQAGKINRLLVSIKKMDCLVGPWWGIDASQVSMWRALQDFWFCPKCPQGHLVHATRNLKCLLIRTCRTSASVQIPMGTFDPCQNVLDIWSRPKYTLRKCSYVQKTHNVYFCFWFTGVTQKILSCIVGPIITLWLYCR